MNPIQILRFGNNTTAQASQLKVDDTAVHPRLVLGQGRPMPHLHTAEDVVEINNRPKPSDPSDQSWGE